MKFLCAADNHIQREIPKYRKDDFFQASLSKLEWQVQTANKLKARLLLAGDIFETAKAGYRVTNAIIRILSKAELIPFACFGNHDTHFHSSNLEGTPFECLLDARVLHNKKGESFHADGGVAIHMLNWGCEVSKPELGKINIFLGHVPVFEDTVPFWCEDGLTPKTLKAKYPGYAWYVTGDIHIPFSKDGVINPGGMMRSTIGQVDHIPCVYLLDVAKGSVEKIHIPIAASEDVFNLDAYDIDQAKDNKALNSFIDTLQVKDDGQKPNFRNTLDAVIKEAQPSKRSKEIISEIMEEV